MVGIFTEAIPINRGLAAAGVDAIPASDEEAGSAMASETLTRNPMPSLWRWAGRQLPEDPAVPVWDVEAANARYGIDGHLKFAEPISETHARELYDLKQEELARRNTLARAEGGFGRTVGDLGIGLGLSMVDPINLASAFVPVVGQSRYALWLARAGGAVERTAVRGAVGMAEGAAGAAMVEPLVYGVAKSEQADYGAADSMLNLAFGTVLGGGLHMGAGAIGDAWARHRGTAPGFERTVDAEVAKRMRGGMTAPDAYVAHAFEAFGMPARDASELERALAAARPETREALLRAAIAQAADDRPVAVRELARLDPAMRGEMLEVGRVVEAAEDDPLGPAGRAIARLSPEGMEEILFRKGEALIDADGNPVVEGARILNTLGRDATRGAVKILVKHGPYSDKVGGPEELLRSDILALPRVVRESLPVNPAVNRQTGQVMEMTWEIKRADGAHVRYSINRSDDGGLLTATIHVRRKGKEGPLSQRRTDPAASPRGLNPGDTGDGIAHRPPQATGPAQPAYARAARRQAGRGHNPRQPHAVFDSDGRRHMVRFELAEADDLVVSHSDDLAENPAFPADLQPRDRTRAVAAAQIGDIVAKFEPERLGLSSDAATGAPIVGDGNVVESGNGRVLAIRRVLAENGEDARRYRLFLASLGLAPNGMQAPVLVRRRLNDLAPGERRAFTVAAQKSGTLDLSATERALADGPRIDRALPLFEGGDIGLARNAGFVRAFVETLPQADHGQVLAPDKTLSRDGRRRIEAAVLARAYDDADLLARMLETDDDNSRAVIGALLDVAGDWAAMRAAVARGEISPRVDATADLLTAVRAVRDARATGRPLAEVLAQPDMFAARSALTDRFLGVLLRDAGDGRVRTAPREAIAADLSRYLDQAMRSRPSPDIFGTAPPTAGELLALLRRATPFDEADVAAARAVERTLAEEPGAGDAGRADPAGDAVLDADIARAIDAGWLDGAEPELAAAARAGEQADGDARLLEAAATCLGRKGR